MTDDERLHRLLRSALPPTEASPPSRSLWPAVVERSQTSARLSSVDLGVAALIALALLMVPRWIWFLAYHL